MFTTQHYVALARTISASLKALWESDEPDGIQVYTLLSYARTLAAGLKADNRLFDEAAFFEACTNGTPYSMDRYESYMLSYLGGLEVLKNNVSAAVIWAGYSDAEPRH